MTKYTAQEKRAIDQAYQAISSLCDCTNWSDAPIWREVTKTERADMASDCPDKTTWARAIVCKAWLEGLNNPDMSARQIYWIRPSYMRAFMLGVCHAIERRNDAYTGPMVEDCAKLCEPLADISRAHSKRITGEL